MDPDQTNCFVLSDLGPSADDISVEGKELTKYVPDILIVERRPDQIPQNALSPPSARKKFESRRSNLFVWSGLIWFQPVC